MQRSNNGDSQNLSHSPSYHDLTYIALTLKANYTLTVFTTLSTTIYQMKPLSSLTMF